VTERAAHLALAAGRPAEGFAIALDGGDGPLALAIVKEAGGVLLWITHGFETVRAIVEHSGEVLVEQSTRLQMMASVLDLKRGEVARAEGRFLRALRMPLDEDGKRDADIVRVALALYGCRDMSKDEWRVLETRLQSLNDSAAMRSYTTSAAAILKLQSGELGDAERVAEAAKVDARFAHSSYAIMYLDFHLACIALARGQATTMREQVQAALARLRSEFRSDTGAQAVAAAFAAEIELELGRQEAARARFLPTMKRLGNLDAWFEVYAAAHETAARLDMLEFGAASAIKKLGHFAELLRSRGLQRVATHLNVLSAVLAGESRLRGDTELVGVTAAFDVSQGLQDGAYWREREACALAEAYGLMEQGRPKEAAGRLAVQIGHFGQMQCRRAELRLRALSVAAHDMARQDKQARGAMSEALALGRLTGYRRSLIDSGGVALVRRLSKLGPSVPPQDRRFADVVLKQVERRQVTSPGTKLTAREQEVLAALNVAHSDKQVARHLGLTEHAVRFHLKNLYRKLRVHSRIDALAQARADGHL
jgi:LuxR family maltose regulon positive regulatory protein